jgi:hypothetical protein
MDAIGALHDDSGLSALLQPAAGSSAPDGSSFKYSIPNDSFAIGADGMVYEIPIAPPADRRIVWADEFGKPLAEVFFSEHLHYSVDVRVDPRLYRSQCCTVM